jgi:hypothetical protein
VEAASSTSNVDDSGRMEVDSGGAEPPVGGMVSTESLLQRGQGFGAGPPVRGMVSTETLLQRGREFGAGSPLWDAPSGEALLEQAEEFSHAWSFGGFDLTSSAGADTGQVGVEAESSMNNVEHSGPGREKIDANIEASDAFAQEEPPTPSIRVLLVQCRYLIPKAAAEDEESDWSDTEVNLLDLKKAGLY